MLTKDKPKKKGKQSVQVGFMMPEGLEKRVQRLGIRGTVCCDIIKQFAVVRELANKSDSTNAITTVDGSILYSADLGNNTYHSVIKQNANTIILEMSGEDMANYVVSLVELLNNQLNKD